MREARGAPGTQEVVNEARVGDENSVETTALLVQRREEQQTGW
jgi:hypothetical protein